MPLARALDVAAHEMTHGVIAATVNLEYKFQSGALNESLADVFGAMVDRDDWKLGEDVANTADIQVGRPARHGGPPQRRVGAIGEPGWQPAHMNEFITAKLEDDNGGVHGNSGIPNRACFLIAKSIGREKTEKIYYRVLEARYLNPGSQFIDMRLARHPRGHGPLRRDFARGGGRQGRFRRGGNRDRIDAGHAHAAAAGRASGGRAGVRGPGERRSRRQQPLCRQAGGGGGRGYRAAYRDPGLYGHGQSHRHHRTTARCCSSSTRSNVLRGIDDAGEQVVSAEGTWKSIAVSPDGAKVAVTTLEPDAKIYILDLVDPDGSKTVSLYTPTTGQAVKAENVVYADALDFNSTGEFLLYDALNRVPQAEGDPIEYWDANLLDIKSGIITPFLPTRPEGISIGNPSFAQTSDLNIVFDLFDEAAGRFTVVAADLFTGASQVIDSNGTSAGLPALFDPGRQNRL